MKAKPMLIRPILFSGEMVNALLDGRKTITRRAIKLKTGETFDERALLGAIQEWRPFWDKVAQRNVGKTAHLIKCPYGKVGDFLYVREKFTYQWIEEKQAFEGFFYFADGQEVRHVDGFDKSPWKPSIHMPRAASRLTLEITDISVERLLDISNKPEDAIGDSFSAGCDDEDCIGYQSLTHFALRGDAKKAWNTRADNPENAVLKEQVRVLHLALESSKDFFEWFVEHYPNPEISHVDYRVEVIKDSEKAIEEINEALAATKPEEEICPNCNRAGVIGCCGEINDHKYYSNGAVRFYSRNDENKESK